MTLRLCVVVRANDTVAPVGSGRGLAGACRDWTGDCSSFCCLSPIRSRLVAVIVDHLEVLYCEGWDPQVRAAAGPLPPALAAQRDRAGEQYAVLLSALGRPLAIIEVAWRDAFCGVRFFDEQRRRIYAVDCRRLAPDRLFVIGGRQWWYADPAQPEFDKNAARREFQVFPDGRARGEIYGAPGEGSGGYTPDPPAAGSYWLDVAQFGEWGRFLGAFPDVLAALGHQVAADAILDEVPAPAGDALPAGGRLWHPPRPLQPEHLDLLFTAGTRLGLDTSEFMFPPGDTVIVELRPAGTLRMPSGRLVAADPTWVEFPPPFTTTVPPGEYPVLLSLVRWADDPEHKRVAAAKLAIRDDPAVSWELALLPGQDPRFLSDEAFYGFGVDAGIGCFLDAAAAPAMARQSEALITGDPIDVTAELSDPESGANLIAFSSGWGDGAYPTWIGRTSNGDLACFIADMVLLYGVVTSFTGPTSPAAAPDPNPGPGRPAAG
jgi:hypothetical protein